MAENAGRINVGPLLARGLHLGGPRHGVQTRTAGAGWEVDPQVMDDAAFEVGGVAGNLDGEIPLEAGGDLPDGAIQVRAGATGLAEPSTSGRAGLDPSSVVFAESRIEFTLDSFGKDGASC